MPGFLYVNKHKKRNIKLNFQNNRLNTTNLTCELCKIGKDNIWALDSEKWIKIFKIDGCTNNFVVDCMQTHIYKGMLYLWVKVLNIRDKACK